jgi:parallel beta-helix repeat protein
MRKTVWLLVVLTSVACASLRTSAQVNRYVSTTGNDSNDGTAPDDAHAWRTIAQANSLAVAGWVIHVGPGTYTSPVTTDHSGTSGSHIRYISDTQWAAKIIISGSTSPWNQRGNYVDIVNFEIQGNGRFGIESNASVGTYVIGNKVHGMNAGGTCTSGAGIVFDTSTSDNAAIGNWVYDVFWGAPAPCYLAHGIYPAGPRGTIENNVVYRTAGWGIQLWHGATAFTISNNTVFNNTQGGILIGCGDATCVVDDNDFVNNNIVINNGGYGIIEQGPTGVHNSYNNNLAFANTTGDWHLQNGLTCSNCITGQNPLLVNYQGDGSGDYHLQSGSPAKRAGTSSNAPSYTFDGAPRPSPPSISAYESQTNLLAAPTGLTATVH